MLARTEYTTKKLERVGTIEGLTLREVIEEVKKALPFDRNDIVITTRGYNHIGFFRPCGGRSINDKIFNIHVNADGSKTLYM